MNPYDDDAPTNVQGTPPPPGQSENSDQKSAITAAVVGTAALGGAAYAMSRFLDDGTTTAENDNNGSDDDGKNEGDPPPQQPPKDDLGGTVPPPPDKIPDSGDGVDTNPGPKTFEEAFAEARAAHGAAHHTEGGGGYFEFDRNGDGKTEYYSTYLDSEWDNLSHHDRQEFYATVPDYHAPSGGGGGAINGLHPTTAVAQNDVPPPVDDVTLEEDSDVMIDDSEANVPVSNASMGGNTPDVARADLDGQEVLLIDIDHDGRPDAIANPDTHVALIDTDHDYILDTRAEYDENGHLMQEERIEENVSVTGNMTRAELHVVEPEPEESTYLAGDSEFGSDFDNQADTSDLDYDHTA